MENIANAKVSQKGKVRDIKTFEMVHGKASELASDLESEAKRLSKALKAFSAKSVGDSGSRGARAQIEDMHDIAKRLDDQATDLKKALSVMNSTLA